MATRPRTPSQQVAAASALKDKKRYVAGYLRVINGLYKRGNFTQEQARLADLAYQRKLPPSAFVTLIRKQDPQYVKTQDFSVRRKEAQSIWQQARPNRPMPQDFSAKYVHSSLNKQQLIERVQRGMQAQKGAAFKPFKPSQNKQAYAQMRAMLNDSFQRRTKKDAPALLHDMVFSTRLRDRHIDEQYPDLFGGKQLFKWMDPRGPDKSLTDSFQKAITPPSPTRALGSAPSVFLDNMQNQFGIGVEDMGSALISSQMK